MEGCGIDSWMEGWKATRLATSDTAGSQDPSDATRSLTLPCSCPASFSGQPPTGSKVTTGSAAPSTLSSSSSWRAPLSLVSFHEPSLQGCCPHLLDPNGLQVGGLQGKVRVLLLEKGKRSWRQQNSNWSEKAAGDGRRGWA